MKDILELDSLDLGWFILFIIPAAFTTVIGTFVVSGNKIMAGLLLTTALIAATWLLLQGIGKWRSWLQRLALTIGVTLTWLLLVENILSYFGKGIC